MPSEKVFGNLRPGPAACDADRLHFFAIDVLFDLMHDII